MKNFLTVSAVAETGAALMLLVLPATLTAWLFGTALVDPAATTVARIAGAGMLALGIACALGRALPADHGALVLVRAMGVYHALAAAVLTHAGLGLGLSGFALWPIAGTHAALAVWAVVCGRRP
jgi:hypothetical protein